MSHCIVILGAGISGLATAWYLKQTLETDASVIVVEKDNRAGGWIQTLNEEGFLFEQGPRSCRSKGGGRETLSLIENLGLQDQVLVPHANASSRYLYDGKVLKRMPKHLWEIPFNPLTKGWLKALCHDWQMPKREEEDESIHSFFSRRLGAKWADNLIDPFVLGIYAGDCRTLSMKSCFQLFDEWERKQGSLLRGAWHHKTNHSHSSSFIDTICRSPLFSFKEGMETLPRALAHELKDSLLLGNGAVGLKQPSTGIEVTLANGGRILADHVISTLPAHALGTILSDSFGEKTLLEPLKYATVGIVNMGFDVSVLPSKGFGYLVPTRLNEIVLGCVWDSCIFPQQSEKEGQTRLTFMLGGSKCPLIEDMTHQQLMEQAERALRQHTGIRIRPNVIQVKKAKQAIPQYAIGHEHWKKESLNKIQQLLPNISLSGTAWHGVSINDCIGQARQLALRLSNRFSTNFY